MMCTMIAISQKHWKGDVADLLRVREGFRLDDVDPSSTPGYKKDKKHGASDLKSGSKQLGELQDRLYAQSRVDATHSAVLLVLQAMDSAGKGGIVRHVVGSVDPQGVSITAFKAPTPEEQEHDFLWRVAKRVPEPGEIAVFDRSHYEDVLIARVRELAPHDELERRYGAINKFEKQLTGDGTRVVKVMLHISRDEQKRRLMRRLDRPDKHWKYNPSDVDERKFWPKYMDAFQMVFDRTSTDHAPWFVVPANHKWYARLAVQHLLLEALEDINPHWPPATFDIPTERRRLSVT
jgi:PPK2 family polyphosphate:nucleotide phosphotransferase